MLLCSIVSVRQSSLSPTGQTRSFDSLKSQPLAAVRDRGRLDQLGAKAGPETFRRQRPNGADEGSQSRASGRMIYIGTPMDGSVS
jgi:hypothetical protein